MASYVFLNLQKKQTIHAIDTCYHMDLYGITVGLCACNKLDGPFPSFQKLF